MKRPRDALPTAPLAFPGMDLRPMRDSPRIRRLRNDLLALERLRSQSTVFDFQASGNPPHLYRIVFKGKGLWRERQRIKHLPAHRVEIKLGPSYPRSVPEIRWLTPIHHPNISEIGLVCLGGFGTHWVPSIQLDELCAMLWDMARYHNYDIRSPYNRDAALWAAHQTTILFPTDPRPIRDLREALGRLDETAPPAAVAAKPDDGPKPRAETLLEKARRLLAASPASTPIETQVVEEVVILDSGPEPPSPARPTEPSRGEDDILFID